MENKYLYGGLTAVALFVGWLFYLYFTTPQPIPDDIFAPIVKKVAPIPQQNVEKYKDKG